MGTWNGWLASSSFCLIDGGRAVRPSIFHLCCSRLILSPRRAPSGYSWSPGFLNSLSQSLWLRWLLWRRRAQVRSSSRSSRLETSSDRHNRPISLGFRIFAAAIAKILELFRRLAFSIRLASHHCCNGVCERTNHVGNWWTSVWLVAHSVASQFCHALES